MTNFEKWKNKIAETNNSHELVETILEVNIALARLCSDCVEYDADCDECKARWLDMEAEDD